MKDRIITLVCLLAVLVSFGLVVSWGRSMMNCEGASASHHYCRYIVQANQGTFRFMKSQLLFANADVEAEWQEMSDAQRINRTDDWSFNWSREMPIVSEPAETFVGFGKESVIVDASHRFVMPGLQFQRTVVQVPHWFVIVLIGGAPTWWLMRRGRIQRDRSRQGLCRRCGFEMGTTYHSCPRCGERAPLPEGFPVIHVS